MSSPEEKVPPKSRKEFEGALRGLGFSHREAKRIAAMGFHAEDETEQGTLEDFAGELHSLAARMTNCDTIDPIEGARNERPITTEKQDPGSQNVRNGQDGAGTPPISETENPRKINNEPEPEDSGEV